MGLILEHHSDDADEQSRVLEGWQQRYEQLGHGRFQGHAWQWVTAQGALLRESTNLHLREQIVPPPDHLVLAVPLAVLPGSRFAGRPLQRESLMVLGDGDEHSLVSAGELDLIGLCVHREMLDQLSGHKLEWLHQAERQRNLDLSPDVAAAIRHSLLALSAQADEGCTNDPAEDTELIGLTLAQTVALAMRDGQRAPAFPRGSQARLKVVERAIVFMQQHMHENIDVQQLCDAVCVSRRSLQYVFEEFLHTTPMAYWRALRLNEARRMLKRSAVASITELAFEWGFASASHFTQHYKSLFGELPSQTAKGQGGDGQAIQEPGRRSNHAPRTAS
jgi:AraC family ethanolamine operon transcriptional activator